MKRTKKRTGKQKTLVVRESVVPYWQGLVNRNMPESLKRAGLKGISDNLKPGEKVQVSGETIFDYFGDEIIEELKKRQKGKNGGKSK